MVDVMVPAAAFRFCLAALLGLLCGESLASEFPGPNLGFESWGKNTTLPEGWQGAGRGYTIGPECSLAQEGRCSLRMSADPLSARTFANVARAFSAAHVPQGHMKLSGAIKTQDVADGWAGLWARVDGSGKRILAFQNMQKEGPTGTTDWARYTIEVDIPSGAQRITFGVLLTGSGTAWFDALDVQVEADSSNLNSGGGVTDPNASGNLSRSEKLLDDAALSIDPSSIPYVQPEWKADVLQRHKKIRSLLSDDFADLGFLTELLKDKRIVMLGESGHGVAEFNLMKVRIAKFLHERLGFDVVAFESSLSGCDLADQHVGIASADEVMRDCIFAIWHTREMLSLFAYIDRQRRGTRPISIAGFDVQNSSAVARLKTTKRITEILNAAEPEASQRFARAEMALGALVRSRPDDAQVDALINDYAYATSVLLREREKLLRSGNVTSSALDIIIQETKSRVVLVKQLSLPAGSPERYELRDKGMAANIEFVARLMYPNRKILVLGHNAHVSKAPGYTRAKPMGEWLSPALQQETFSIAMYMGRGVAAGNNRQRYDIESPSANSLEAVMANAGVKYAFFDLHDLPGWAAGPIAAREWGKTSFQAYPARMYDGLIYIDTVSAPQYLSSGSQNAGVLGWRRDQELVLGSRGMVIARRTGAPSAGMDSGFLH